MEKNYNRWLTVFVGIIKGIFFGTVLWKFLLRLWSTVRASRLVKTRTGRRVTRFRRMVRASLVRFCGLIFCLKSVLFDLALGTFAPNRSLHSIELHQRNENTLPISFEDDPQMSHPWPPKLAIRTVLKVRCWLTIHDINGRTYRTNVQISILPASFNGLQS